MKIKTVELTGVALDWAVAKCEGATNEWDSDKPFFWHRVACIRIDGHDVNYTPSTSWLMGGPIIEREGIQLARVGNVWEAWVDADGVFCQGPTPLIAAMRCYVASELGDEVEIPEELT